jgi:drug/metabolite transporter (DMT)-like permease
MLAVAASLLWASSIVLVKLGLEDLPPLTFASLRYLVGAATLLGWRLARRGTRGPRIDGRTARWLLVLGVVLYAAVPAAQFVGLDRVEAVVFNFVFQAGIPLVLALAAGVVLREPTSRFEWFGVALVIAGVYVFYPAWPATSELAGAGFALAAAVGIGVSNLIQRLVMRSGSIDALDATLLPMGLGSLLLAGYAVAVEPFPTLRVGEVVLVLVLGVVNTALAFTLWHRAMATLAALHAGIIASAQIVEVPILAIVILGESLTTGRIVGSLVVLAGILAVHISKASAASPATVAAPATTPEAGVIASGLGRGPSPAAPREP